MSGEEDGGESSAGSWSARDNDDDDDESSYEDDEPKGKGSSRRSSIPTAASQKGGQRRQPPAATTPMVKAALSSPGKIQANNKETRTIIPATSPSREEGATTTAKADGIPRLPVVVPSSTKVGSSSTKPPPSSPALALAATQQSPDPRHRATTTTTTKKSVAKNVVDDEPTTTTLCYGEMDVIMPNKLPLECGILVQLAHSDSDNGGSWELDGATGAVGRLEVNDNGVILDLKGSQYRGTLFPCATAMVLTVITQRGSVSNSSNNNSNNTGEVVDNGDTSTVRRHVVRVDGITDEFCRLVPTGRNALDQMSAVVHGNVNNDDDDSDNDNEEDHGYSFDRGGRQGTTHDASSSSSLNFPMNTAPTAAPTPAATSSSAKEPPSSQPTGKKRKAAPPPPTTTPKGGK